MTKRTAVAVALAAGCVLGGFLGFIGHAPGRASTWTDARGWATFLVVALGLSVAAYELNLQRRQFAEEAKRNEARDDLLDRQRRELQLREQLREREQAESVDLTWNNNGPGSYAQVVNDSRRPVRNVACQIRIKSGDLVPADLAGELMPVSREGSRAGMRRRRPLSKAGVLRSSAAGAGRASSSATSSATPATPSCWSLHRRRRAALGTRPRSPPVRAGQP